ncbi:hypothetical protein Moror_10714 [Moniliophthora roreri MCA 2997]|uniref:Uncharacterized protein n=1 Tax=Moniliophthora roreri (strain MCA 2997) TaxID=1381753 RepID=V2WXV4_MONRO|nr:hypothetical protein Moror_10714 [Moniliophthora roreri MCA 2997]
MPFCAEFDIFNFEAVVDDVLLSKRDEIADIIDMYCDFDDAAGVVESETSSESGESSSGFEVEEDVEEMEKQLDVFVDANKASEVYGNFFLQVDQLVEFEDFNHSISFKMANTTPTLLVTPATPRKSKTSTLLRAPVNPAPYMALPPTPPQARELKSQQQTKPQVATLNRARRVTSRSMLDMMLSVRRR